MRCATRRFRWRRCCNPAVYAAPAASRSSGLCTATASLFIVNPFSSGQRLLSLFSTHPDMEERVRRLRGMDRAGAAVYR